MANSPTDRQIAAQSHNRRVWDKMARDGKRFTRPVTEQELSDPLKVVDSSGWLGPSIHGKKVLCLAAGGGRQGPLYAAAGAHVTVVDISPSQLELDNQFAESRGIEMHTIATSMDDLSMLGDASFDIVIQPVSTCYLPDVRPVYDEVARVLQDDGLYISQHKQPTSMQTETRTNADGLYSIAEPYYRDGPLPAVANSLHREEGTLEYLHRLGQLLGSMCRAGMLIHDIVEPHHGDTSAPPGSFGHRSNYVAPYVRVKASRIARDRQCDEPTRQFWLP